MMNFLLNLPWDIEKIMEYHLLLAKIHLLAKRNQEALKELETFLCLKSQEFQKRKGIQEISPAQEIIQKISGFKRKSLHGIIQDMLNKNIQERLIENADQLLLEGKFDEAFLLQKKAESLNPQQFESSLWFHLSLAESCLKKGMKDEAVTEYKKALLLCATPAESDILKKIIEIRGLNFGYFVWRK